jgi:heterodisulfide reductase subunit A-like polyferredoxin
MQAWSNGTPMLASSGYISQVDNNLCTGCSTCIEVCQFKAIDIIGDKVHVNEEHCMGCGVCVSKCDHKAHLLIRDPSKSEPLEIFKLINSLESN